MFDRVTKRMGEATSNKERIEQINYDLYKEAQRDRWLSEDSYGTRTKVIRPDDD